jgi:dienelactone hydrolase
VQNVLEYLLEYDVSVFSFDFSGSGQSEGEYVSLGYHEEQDLRIIIDYLRRSRLVDSIALWGWSMGAVTAILRAAEDPLISACVLDSPFADFRTLAGELARSVVPTLPEMLNGFAFGLACDEACSRAGFDPGELRPIRSASKASVPALFCVAKGDTLTAPHHTTEVHAAWGGDKELVTFAGDHTSDRPAWFMEQAAKFLWDHFQKDASDQHKRRAGFFSIFPVKADGEVAELIRNCQPVTICNGPKKEAAGASKALTNLGPAPTFETSAQPKPVPSCLCSEEVELEEPPPIPADLLPSLPPKLSSHRSHFPFFRNESVMEI